MSRFNKYNNIHDPDDDGADIEITEQHYALSDEEGRREAVVLLQTGNAIKGTGKHVHDHRRMFYRWAKKELVDGRARREAAEAADKATAAADQKAERDRIAREEQTRKNKEKLVKSGEESDAMWARLDEETRVANAAWAAGREERERAASQQPVVSPVSPPVRRADDRPARPQLATQRIPATPVARPPSNPSNWPFDQVQKPLPAAATRQPEPAPPRTVAPAAGSRRPDHRFSSTPVPTRSGTAPSERHPTPMPPTRPTTPSITRAVPTASRQPALPPQSSAPQPPVRPLPSPPVVQRMTAPVLPPAPTLNGAHLVGWRASAGLTQRAAAERLGVAPSTVAKAELLPDKALGDQLRAALAGLLPR